MDHFRYLAPFYDRAIRILDRDRLISLLRLPVEGLLLDAGGGTGRVSSRLRDLVAGVVVSDLSFPMLRQAEKKGALSPVRSRVERLPFPDGSFDRVLVVDAFHHFGDQRGSVGECLRVLKPGGTLVIEEPDIRRFPIRGVALGERLLGMGSRFRPPDEIADLIRGYGLAPRVVDDGRLLCWVAVDKPETA